MFLVSLRKALLAATTALSVSTLVSAQNHGQITSPTNGTGIAAGASFSFSYNPQGDYCVSGLNYSVWLFTTPPDSPNYGNPATWLSGRFLGRYSSSNNPPDGAPVNPAPAQLTMPDFSQTVGFAVGKSVANVPVYLTVLEEYATCSPTLGVDIGFSYQTLIYNPKSSGGGGGGSGGSSGTKTIRPGKSNNMCLTASNSDGAALTIQTCSGASNQKWTYTNGISIITGSNKCLDVPSGSTAMGQKMQVWTCGGGNPNQEWAITNDNRIAWMNHGECLDLSDGSTSNGNKIQMWACTDNNPNQVWNLV